MTTEKKEIDPRWKDRAICHDVPDENYSSGHYADLPKLQQFIEDYCMFCPVAQECIDDSWAASVGGPGVTDEMFWTVRGGYLPTDQPLQKRGRPAKAQEFPVRIEPGRLKVGPNGFAMCKNGLHEMTAENTRVEKHTKRCWSCYRTRKKREEKGKPTCVHGHKWVPGSYELTLTGKKRCLVCDSQPTVKMCKAGLHEMKHPNLLRMKRHLYCKTCFEANTSATIEA